MEKPHVTESDDGTIWIEFIKNNKRFSICLEKDLSESSWNYVDLHDDIQCELLSDKMIEYLKKFDSE